jgi:preprotein translocase subunit YajC
MNDLLQFTPFVLMLVIMYVLVIRPQVKEKESLERMIASLAKDDEIVTGSGLHGRIVRVGETTFEVEIAKGVVVRLERTGIARKVGKAEKGGEKSESAGSTAKS